MSVTSSGSGDEVITIYKRRCAPGSAASYIRYTNLFDDFAFHKYLHGAYFFLKRNQTIKSACAKQEKVLGELFWKRMELVIQIVTKETHSNLKGSLLSLFPIFMLPCKATQVWLKINIFDKVCSWSKNIHLILSNIQLNLVGEDVRPVDGNLKWWPFIYCLMSDKTQQVFPHQNS